MSNPDGPCGSGRRALLDKIGALDKLQLARELDPEIESRIAQYEMAYRMQTSVPEAIDLSAKRTAHLNFTALIAQAGTFAANCLLAPARRTRSALIQLYHQVGTKHESVSSEHTALPSSLNAGRAA